MIRRRKLVAKIKKEMHERYIATNSPKRRAVSNEAVFNVFIWGVSFFIFIFTMMLFGQYKNENIIPAGGSVLVVLSIIGFTETRRLYVAKVIPTLSSTSKEGGNDANVTDAEYASLKKSLEKTFIFLGCTGTLISGFGALVGGWLLKL